MNSLKIRQSGKINMGVAFISLIIATAALFAYVKYQEIYEGSKGSVEGGLIEVIRIGIYEYAVEAKKSGAEKIFPPFLDEAKPGISAPDNLFFTFVLGKRVAVGSGIAVEGWSKTSKHEYIGPSGKQYIYSPDTGVFDVSAK